MLIPPSWPSPQKTLPKSLTLSESYSNHECLPNRYTQTRTPTTTVTSLAKVTLSVAVTLPVTPSVVSLSVTLSVSPLMHTTEWTANDKEELQTAVECVKQSSEPAWLQTEFCQNIVWNSIFNLVWAELFNSRQSGKMFCPINKKLLNSQLWLKQLWKM